MPPKHELVREWLRLAQNDLASARHLRRADQGLAAVESLLQVIMSRMPPEIRQ